MKIGQKCSKCGYDGSAKDHPCYSLTGQEDVIISLTAERDAYREELDRVRKTAKKHGRLVNIPRSVLVAIEVIARNVLSKYPAEQK